MRWESLPASCSLAADRASSVREWIKSATASAWARSMRPLRNARRVNSPGVANRAPLMQYLQAAWEPRLKAALADKGQFAAKTDEIVKEAELFAAIGEVLTKEGMEDADSDEYKALSHRLRDGGKQILDAVKLKNYEQASSAAAAIGKACAECHENYR